MTEPRIIDAVWEMTNRHLTWPGFSRVKPRKSSIMLLAFLGLGIPAGPDLVELICRRRYATHIAVHVVGYVSFDGQIDAGNPRLETKDKIHGLAEFRKV